MRVKLTSLALCAIGSSTNNPVAFYQGKIIDSHVFCREVADKTQRLRQQPEESYSLYYEESYPFTVMLFALLHAGKEIWIAANNKQMTAEKLIQQGSFLLGDWQGKETFLDDNVGNIPTLAPLDLKTAELVIFTSGSSGQAKAIRKSFWQFQREIETLEHQWVVYSGRLMHWLLLAISIFMAYCLESCGLWLLDAVLIVPCTLAQNLY